MLLGDEERAVGRPARLIEQAEILLRDLALVAAVAVHQPDIVAARAVGDEGDALAVGREARLMLKGETLGDSRRRPALDRRSEEHTSELQSLMRISYAVFCLQKTNSSLSSMRSRSDSQTLMHAHSNI